MTDMTAPATADKIVAVAHKFGLEVHIHGADKLVSLDGNGWIVLSDTVRTHRRYRFITQAVGYESGDGTCITAKRAGDLVALAVHARRQAEADRQADLDAREAAAAAAGSPAPLYTALMGQTFGA